jgi:deazaflavin-dependent oxidoreductase (nitroreductase family)
MSVDLTPKGTYGVNMKMPRPMWKVIQVFISLGVRLRGGQLLTLTTVGAKTGRTHCVPLAWYPAAAGEAKAWLIVASYAGAAKHPAWYINMAKNPDKVWVEVDHRKTKVTAESLKGAEREAAWRRIVAAAPNYNAYQSKTDREIPVVRLRAAV